MIGSLGKVVFKVSDKQVLTFNDFKRKTSKKTTTHDVIKGKPRLEYLGADLSTISFSIHLNALYGVKPKEELEKLHKMAEGKKCYPLIIGGTPIGDNDWCVDEVSETWGTVYGKGELASANVSLTLTEYAENL